MNDFIGSIIIYPNNSSNVYRKGFNHSYDYNYSPKKEHWYQKVIEADGKEVVIGIHRELQTSSGKPYVLTLGRSILKSFEGTLNSYAKTRLNGEKVLIVSSISQYTSWKVVNIIPEKELFSYALYASLLGKNDVLKLSAMEFIPLTRLTLENYIYVCTKCQLLTWLKNSIVMAAGILIGNLVVNTMAAYALAKIKLPGRNIFFFINIGMMMVPY